jgi:hypothetical protein
MAWHGKDLIPGSSVSLEWDLLECAHVSGSDGNTRVARLPPSGHSGQQLQLAGWHGLRGTTEAAPVKPGAVRQTGPGLPFGAECAELCFAGVATIHRTEQCTEQ